MLPEKTMAKIKDEIIHIGRAVMAVLLGEISNSLEGFSKDMAAKNNLSTKEDKVE